MVISCIKEYGLGADIYFSGSASVSVSRPKALKSNINQGAQRTECDYEQNLRRRNA